MMLRWGVLGASGVAHRRTMPAIKAAKNAELWALMTRNIERSKKLAAEHDAKRYYDNVDELIADENLDALYIASPVYLHCEHLLKAVQRGLHILCEKPMAMNVDECQRMIEACNSKNLQLQVCFLWRFHSCFQKVKSLISSGALGEIVEVRAPFLKWYPMPEGAWRGDPKQSGGGTLTDLGTHNLDLIRYLLEEDVSEVTAYTTSRITNWKVDETAIVLMKMKNGVYGIMDCSFMVKNCDIILEVYGIDGTAFVYNDNGWKIKTFIKGEYKFESSPFENLYQAQIEHFARCLAGEEKPLVAGEDGLKNIQIIAAAYQSSQQRRTISLDHPPSSPSSSPITK